MGVRRSTLLLASLALAACGEADDRDAVTGPEFKPGPPPAGSCSLGSLPGLIRDYFPGPRQKAIVALSDQLAAAGARTPGARTAGFEIMDSIGSLSRNTSETTDPTKGATLTVALVDCMFANATTSAANFTSALTRDHGGAYYVRGGGAGPSYVDPPGRTASVIGTDYVLDATPTNLSGVKPAAGKSWSAVLAGNTASEGRALFYGFKVADAPLVYEWLTVPATATFTPGVTVSVCDGVASDSAMVVESSVGVLAFTADDLCGAPQSLTLDDAGWGPRALAGRLAQVVVDALTPEPLQAAVVVAARTGSGGTATTFKSRFRTELVTDVTLEFGAVPRNLTVNENHTVLVRATSLVDGTVEGVNGVCVYVTGTNNNGQGTALVGTVECDNTPSGGISAETRSRNDVAGYAEFTFKVTKTGGLNLVASSTDAGGKSGVLERDGQTFTTDVVKTNVKP